MVYQCSVLNTQRKQWCDAKVKTAFDITNSVFEQHSGQWKTIPLMNNSWTLRIFQSH